MVVLDRLRAAGYGRHMAHLDREIAAQPEVAQRLLDREGGRIGRMAASIRRAGLRSLFVVARGSSDNAGIYGKYLFGARNRMVTALAAPSLFTLYQRPPDLRGQLVLALSQSGESHDLGQVVQEAGRQGARTLVVTNRPRSPLARAADHVIPLHASAERSVAATKTYTAELLALAMLSAALDGRRADRRALERVPAALAGALDACVDMAPGVERYRYLERMVVIGRGFNYATAFELALKLKELAYVTAEPYSSADFRHGPIAVVQDGFAVLLIAPGGRTAADQRALIAVLQQRRAELLVISDLRELLAGAHTPLPIPKGLPEWLSPLACAVPGQLFARHLAAVRDCPLDTPRGLNKVTRTR